MYFAKNVKFILHLEKNWKVILSDIRGTPLDMIAAGLAYYALQESGGLIITGATGTNVNDVAVLLLSKE